MAGKDDLHWSGSAWVGCPYPTRNATRLLDSAGVNRISDYCDGYAQTRSHRASVDVAGQTMTSVISTIRSYPGGDSGINYANWGPANLAALGNATFPSGSTIVYQDNVDIAPRAIGYTPGATPVIQNRADVAAGGDARAGGTPACSTVVVSTPASACQSSATTLEGLIAVTRGTPCVYTPGADPAGGSTGPRSEWWGNSTLSIGTLAGAASVPANTGGFYSTTAALRLAFTGSGNTVTYYNCLQRALSGATRNCDPVGSGTYEITTLGDSRVMTFTGMPALFLRLTNEPVLVERGGFVYQGYRSRPVNARLVQLNLTATNALFGQLGVPAIQPQ